MVEEAPKSCRDCRHFQWDDTRCLHPKSKSYDAIGDAEWKWAEQMRNGIRFDAGVCGRDAALFEPEPPLTTGQVILRASIPVAILLAVAGCSFQQIFH